MADIKKINSPKINIYSVFGENMNILEEEKAYIEGVYCDSPANRKLGRVGMTYKEWTEKQSKKDKSNKEGDWKDEIDKDSIEEIEQLIQAHHQNEGSGYDMYERTFSSISDIVGGDKAEKILKQEGIKPIEENEEVEEENKKKKKESKKKNSKLSATFSLYNQKKEVEDPILKENLKFFKKLGNLIEEPKDGELRDITFKIDKHGVIQDVKVKTKDSGRGIGGYPEQYDNTEYREGIKNLLEGKKISEFEEEVDNIIEYNKHNIEKQLKIKKSIENFVDESKNKYKEKLKEPKYWGEGRDKEDSPTVYYHKDDEWVDDADLILPFKKIDKKEIIKKAYKEGYKPWAISDEYRPVRIKTISDYIKKKGLQNDKFKGAYFKPYEMDRTNGEIRFGLGLYDKDGNILFEDKDLYDVDKFITKMENNLDYITLGEKGKVIKKIPKLHSVWLEKLLKKYND